MDKPDSLLELGDIIATTASKKEEPLFETAAAIYVITREEIRRSGPASIPEVLRLVQGLEVAGAGTNESGFGGLLWRKTRRQRIFSRVRQIFRPG